MKCPNCGSEIEEGKLLCSECGAEIQYVPNYEPEIEHSLDTTIHGIKSEIFENEKKKNTFLKSNPIAFWIVLISVFLILIFGIVLLVHYVRNNSFDYQYSRAISYANEGDYGHALDSLEIAISLDDENIDLILLEASYYDLYGFRDTSKSILENAILAGHDTLEINEKLISYYIDEEDYVSVVTLIENSKNSLVYEKYKSYISLPPKFSSEPGVFYNKLSLEIIGGAEGKIFYTLNGTIPSESSFEYVETLYLDEGVYHINAIYENDMGVRSQMISGIFTVDLSKPFAPDVNIYSGLTVLPEAIIIEVQEECQVLYSLDGSDLTEESLHYKSPIAMPLGSFTLRCVTVNQDGEFSEETKREVDFVIPGEITADDAIRISYQELIALGKLLNESGQLLDGEGNNSYNTTSAFSYEENPYYLIYELHTDLNGMTKRTGNLFGVHMLTGAFTNVAFDEEGNYRTY